MSNLSQGFEAKTKKSMHLKWFLENAFFPFAQLRIAETLLMSKKFANSLK